MSRPLTAVVVVVLVAVVTAPVAGSLVVTADTPTGTTAGGESTIGPGDQLQGVVGVQEAEVGGDIEERAFGLAFTDAFNATNASTDGGANASRAAAVVSAQVTDLRSRIDRLERRKAGLEAARENGTIDGGEFRARMAVLAAEIATARRLANGTANAARRVPAAALEERGVDPASVRSLGRRASNLTGPEVAAVARSVAGNGVGKGIAGRNKPNVTGPPSGVPGGGSGRPGRGNGTDRPGGGNTAGPPGGDDTAGPPGGGNTDDPPGNGGPPGGEDPGGPPGSGNDTDTPGGDGAMAIRAGGVAGDTAPTGTPRPASLASEQWGARGVWGGAAAGAGTFGDRSGGARPLAVTESEEGVPLFTVGLRSTDPARVTLQLTFDLTTDTDRRAFETLRDDTDARADVRDRFRNRMQSVADNAERRVDREMTVSDAEIALTRSNSTGIVTLSVVWAELAGRAGAAAEPNLVITEPFASGFTPSREFTVRILAPENYRLTRVTPEPMQRTERSASWAAGTSLDAFLLEFTPRGGTPLPTTVIEGFDPVSPTTTASTGGVSGATLSIIVVVVVAVVIGGFVAWRRREAD